MTTTKRENGKESERLPFVKTEFDKLAIDGAIGYPDGKLGYSYIRVSSDEQGEEGRSGLPRQIEHVHEKAFQAGIRIPWEMVFADDFTGFELERPELDRLRTEYRGPHRRASAIVMEHLDRLSRNADWHQGYLLDEMKKRGIDALFWKTFSSRIERVVMGTIAQEGMEQALERMADGTRKKAESGRVTARRPAFGFRFVDENDNESERARKFTYYAIREDQAAIVRLIYERIVRGDTMIQIAKDLDEAGVPKPKRTTHWEGSLLPKLVRNPVYKGEFIAHCFTTVKVEKPTKDGLSTKLAKKKVMRPESDWIRVPVPAIVDPVTWQAANDMLAKNRTMAARNADTNERYLLTGLVKCADCGYSYGGRTQHPTPRSTLKHSVRSYFCRKATPQPRHIAAGAAHACHQRQIAANVLETAVWRVVCDALLKPDVLLAALEADAFNDQNAQLEQQIAYLEEEISAKTKEDEKLYRAYIAGVFDEIEYADRRHSLKLETTLLESERNKLLPQRVSIEQLEAQKALVRQFAERLQSLNLDIDPPFEVKQRILKMTVDVIALNAREGWFKLEGVIRGKYDIENSSVREYRARLPASAPALLPAARSFAAPGSSRCNTGA